MNEGAVTIVNLLGGIRPLAKALGHKNPTTVKSWTDNGIPPWRFHELLQAAKRRKIKLPAKELAEARSK